MKVRGIRMTDAQNEALKLIGHERARELIERDAVRLRKIKDR